MQQNQRVAKLAGKALAAASLFVITLAAQPVHQQKHAYIVLANHNVEIVNVSNSDAKEVMKQFEGKDCYAIDPANGKIYFVHQGSLSPVKTDDAGNRDAEYFEQAYQAR